MCANSLDIVYCQQLRLWPYFGSTLFVFVFM